MNLKEASDYLAQASTMDAGLVAAQTAYAAEIDRLRDAVHRAQRLLSLCDFSALEDWDDYLVVQETAWTSSELG